MRPRVALLHHARSFFPLDLNQMVGEAFEVIWVVDAATAEDRTTMRLLSKLGPVVELGGLDIDTASGRLAEQRPEGIVSFVDDNLELASQLAARLNLIYHPPPVATTLVDKRLQRAALDRAGIPGPGFWTIPGGMPRAEVEALAGTITYPAVLKPSEGSGSRGIIRVEGPEDLIAAVVGEGGDHDCLVDGYLVEEYLLDETAPGQWFASYFSVESVISRGRVSHVAVTGRFPLAEPFRETGNFLPDMLDPRLQATALSMVDATIEALDIRDAVIHTEIKQTPDGLKLIEVNGRLGGRPPFVLASVSDINLFQTACQIAVGIPVSFDGLVETQGVGFWLMRQPPVSANRVTSVEGLAGVSDMAGVDDVILSKGPGSPVDWREGTDSQVATVRGRVADHQALAATIASIEETMVIEYDG